MDKTQNQVAGGTKMPCVNSLKDVLHLLFERSCTAGVGRQNGKALFQKTKYAKFCRFFLLSENVKQFRIIFYVYYQSSQIQKNCVFEQKHF